MIEADEGIHKFCKFLHTEVHIGSAPKCCSYTQYIAVL